MKQESLGTLQAHMAVLFADWDSFPVILEDEGHGDDNEDSGLD